MNETVPTFDSTINIISAISIAAILSPMIVALINGIFSTLYKYMEYRHTLEMKKLETYYSECSSTFSDLLSSSGKLLANPYSDVEILNTLALLYKSYSYADEQLVSALDVYYQKLEAWNNDLHNSDLLDDVQSYVIVLSREINRFLLAMAGTDNKLRCKLCKSMRRIRNTK